MVYRNLEKLNKKKKFFRSEVKDSAVATGSVNNKRVASDVVKEEEVDEEKDNDEGNTSGNAMVEVKLEKQEEAGLLVTCGIQKRKRLARGGKSNFSFEVQKKCKQPVSATRATRWPNER